MSFDKQTSMFIPTDEQRVALLDDSVFYEIIFAFGISSHDPTDDCAWEHINFSRMGHARTLYDFFETPTTKRKTRRRSFRGFRLSCPAHRTPRR
jgi:hypothetical protein